MKTIKLSKFFFMNLVLIVPLLLGPVDNASSFSQQSGEAGNAGQEKPNNITMQSVSGTVVETMDSGGYTYALVDEGDKRTWVALPSSRIAVGNEITCKPGMVMNNFSSSSLRRVFKHIVFSGGITSIAAGTATETEPPPQEEPIELPKVKDSKDWQEFFD